MGLNRKARRQHLKKVKTMAKLDDVKIDFSFDPAERRVYFAGLAMQALIPLSVTGEVDDYPAHLMAQDAVRYADALVAELDKGKTP